MIPPNQIESFFQDTLQFPNWKKVMDSNKLEFLTELVQRVQFNSYFHNTFMVSTPPEKRRSPRMEEAIKSGIEGTGGVCLHQNSFMTYLLRTIGFDTFLSAGSCDGAAEEGSHAMCILKLNSEETYAIDVGCGQPVNEPIPLHKLPYSRVAAGFRYEYRYNEENGDYERWQFDGAFFRGKFTDPDKSMRRYRFTIKPREFSYFQATLVDIFTNYETSIFMKVPFLFRCLDLEKPENVNGRRFILIFGASIVIYDNVNREVTNFDSYNDLRPDILKYFPKIDPIHVDKALEWFTANAKEIILGRTIRED